MIPGQVDLPGRVVVDPPSSTSAAALAVADDVREVGAHVYDIAEAMRSGGRPRDWTGDASEAAGHAMTLVVDELDVSVRGLRRAAVVATEYADRLSQLEARCERINGAWEELEGRSQQLATMLNGRLTAEAAAGLEGAVKDLWDRDEELHQKVRHLRSEEQEATDLFVRRLERLTPDGVREQLAEAYANGRGDQVERAERLQRELLALEGDPAAANRWWAGLREGQRQTLLMADADLISRLGLPEVVLDGVDDAVRHTADD